MADDCVTKLSKEPLDRANDEDTELNTWLVVVNAPVDWITLFPVKPLDATELTDVLPNKLVDTEPDDKAGTDTWLGALLVNEPVDWASLLVSVLGDWE